MNPPYPCMMDRIISQQVVPGVTRCEPAMTDDKNKREHTTVGDNVYIYMPTLRRCTDELRDQYENSSARFGRRVLAWFLNRLKIS